MVDPLISTSQVDSEAAEDAEKLKAATAFQNLTDLAQLKALFHSIGIPYKQVETQTIGYQDIRSQSEILLVVSHHNYHFASNGKYLGLENEDFREFIPRK